MGNQFSEAEHFWPSRELLSELDRQRYPDQETARCALVGAVFNSIGRLYSVSYQLEGGYLYFAQQGQLDPFFAEPILNRLQMTAGGPADRFCQLLHRDLSAKLADGNPYGPSRAYVFADQRGNIVCSEDSGFSKRRPRPPQEVQKIA